MLSEKSIRILESALRRYSELSAYSLHQCDLIKSHCEPTLGSRVFENQLALRRVARFTFSVSLEYFRVTSSSICSRQISHPSMHYLCSSWERCFHFRFGLGPSRRGALGPSLKKLEGWE